MLITQGNLSNVFTGFNGAFNKGFAGAESNYQKLAMVVPSSTGKEIYGWLGQLPKMREWIGDRVIKSMTAKGYEIENLTFESTISVARKVIEDDQFGVFGPMFDELGKASAEHPDEMIFNLLAGGFTTKCYDGQNFFDTNHPVTNADGNTTLVANSDGGTGTAWFLLDTSRAAKPLIYQERLPYKLTRMDNDEQPHVFMKDEYIYGVRARSNAGYGFWQMAWGSKQTLDAAHYESARIGLAGIRGDEGRLLGIRPDTLVVPPALEGAARRLIGNQKNAAGADNEWYGTANIVVARWLAT